MQRLSFFLAVSLLAILPFGASAGPGPSLGPENEAVQEPATAEEYLAPEAAPGPRPVVATGRAPRFGVSEAYLHDASAQLGITWQRLIFSWADIQPGGPADWRADQYFRPEVLKQQIDRGTEIVGVLQFTPGWAAANPSDGQRSVPRNLSLPPDSPENYWARFAGRMAAHYKGRIDRWVIWNEPEFKPGDKGAGQSYTFLGSDSDYYLLLKRAYQAIKTANPNATVVFGGTSYWVDINMGRTPFFVRLLDRIAADPEAFAGNHFFDAVAFNLYWAPDDLLRVFVEMHQAMKSRGLDKPIWLSETNAMPCDDPITPKPANGQRVSLSLQADYAVQALAIAAAAGYERVGWYRMSDGPHWREQEAWGLLRDDGSVRPVFAAYKTALSLFSRASRVSFVPLERADQPFGTPWPQDANSYYPNWQVYQVVFDHADGRRVTVLWNATGDSLRVRVPRMGSGADLVNGSGESMAIAENGGWYVVDLAPATVTGPLDPEGYHYVGGSPLMLVERNVPAGSPIQEPRLGDPGSVQPGLELTLDPAAQKFYPGDSVRFTLRLRGIEGFNAPVRLSVPDLPPGATVEFPEAAYPGDRIVLTVRSEPSLAPNLYILTLNATGGGITSGTDLVLEVPAR